MTNMVAIQTVTVGSGGAANITFSNIPQTYTDLKIVMSVRTNLGSGNIYDIMNVAVNGGSTKIAYTSLYGNGSATGSEKYTTASNINWSGYPQANGGTASVFSNVEYYFPNYTGSNKKSFSWDNVVENNGTSVITALGASLWDSTNAITSIEFSSANAVNFLQYSTATLYGVTNAAATAKATGGLVTYDSNYFYHTFTASGTFTPLQSLTADYLVVAGGGGGISGGGGAGGLRCTVGATGGGGSLESALSLTAQAYTVTVGAGGTGGTSGLNPDATNGSNSVFSTITSIGGGKGGRQSFDNSAANGGSGGGSGRNSTTKGTGTSGQGYDGGAGSTSLSGLPAGGGGGAGAVGGNATSGQSGAGGNGVTTSISGSSATYGGGGGAAGDAGCAQSNGGSGGGGNGSGSAQGTAGTANTGGGGGGGYNAGGATPQGANGGSGIVIVRYAR